MIRSAPLIGGVAWLLTVATVVAIRPSQQPSGVAGVPVEGHEIVAIFDFHGIRQLDWKRVEARFPAEDIRIRLGRPLDSNTICRVKELVRDAMAEKGFPNAEVTHDVIPLPQNRFGANAVKVTLNITDGERSRAVKTPMIPLLSTSQRCAR